MRVLWFSPIKLSENSPLIGGWISALKTALIKHTNYELGIAFHSNNNHVIVNNNVTYFNIDVSFNNLTKKILFNHSHSVIYPSIVEKYVDVVNKFKPDIIQVFGTEHSFGEIIKHIQIPTVIHIQGIANPYLCKWFSGGYTQLDVLKYGDKFKLLKGSGLFHEFYKFRNRAINERYYFSYNKYFIGRTDWDKNITRFLAPQAKYYHCDELLRSEFYDVSWKKPSNNKFRIISVLNPNLYKGIEIVYKTAKLLSNNKVKQFEWQIVGVDKNSELLKILYGKFPKFKEIKEVKILGRANAKVMINDLLNSNCFVHLSHIDNSPNSVCEAMLLGIPTISSAVGGITSLITDKYNGILVQEGEAFSFASSISDIMSNNDFAEKLGLNARETALIRHNDKKVIEDLSNIYEKIIDENNV